MAEIDLIWRSDAIDRAKHAWAKGLEPSQYIELIPSAQPETFEWCHDCKEYDQEKHCCHRWTKQIRKTVAELEADYPKAMKDELEYWKKRAEKAESDYYITVTGVRKYVPNIDLEEVEEDV